MKYLFLHGLFFFQVFSSVCYGSTEIYACLQNASNREIRIAGEIHKPEHPPTLPLGVLAGIDVVLLEGRVTPSPEDLTAMRKRSPRLLREVLSESLAIELSEYFKVDATKLAGVAASGALVERVYAKSVIDLGLTKPQTSVSPNDISLGRQIDKKAQELGVKIAQLEELFRHLDALEGVPQQDYSRAIEKALTCSRDPLCIEKYADLGLSASRCKTIDCLRDTYDFSRRSGLYEAFALPARNSNMLETILSYIPSGNVLVVVGALHMLGPQGLISLLHGEGFKDSECGFN